MVRWIGPLDLKDQTICTVEVKRPDQLNRWSATPREAGDKNPQQLEALKRVFFFFFLQLDRNPGPRLGWFTSWAGLQADTNF